MFTNPNATSTNHGIYFNFGYTLSSDPEPEWQLYYSLKQLFLKTNIENMFNEIKDRNER